VWSRGWGILTQEAINSGGKREGRDCLESVLKAGTVATVLDLWIMSVAVCVFVPHMLAASFPLAVNLVGNRKHFCQYWKHDTAETNSTTSLILKLPPTISHQYMPFYISVTFVGFILYVI
jgi:hypothetical protein